MRFIAAPVAASLMLAGCGTSQENQEVVNDATAIADNMEAMADKLEAEANAVIASANASTSNATTPYPIEACKAAVAAIDGRDPATMKAKKLPSGLIHVSYVRPDDGKRWQSRCRIDGPDRLTWAAFDAFGDGQQGRWRDEDDVRFKIEGKNMRLTLSTGGELMTDETYPLSTLR